jgi:hypothetical protein
MGGTVPFLLFSFTLLRAVIRPAVADVVFRNERAHDGPTIVVGLLSDINTYSVAII